MEYGAEVLAGLGLEPLALKPQTQRTAVAPQE